MALEERLGSYELAPAVASRDAREPERRAAAGIAERVERLRAQPELILDRLAEMRAVWNGADVEREGGAVGAGCALRTRCADRHGDKGGGRGVAGDRHGCVYHRTGGERRASGVRGGGDCRRGEVAAAARRRRGIGEAGFLVFGTPVAGDAARTLGEEAAIDTRTVRAAARGSQDRSRSVRPLIFRRERECEWTRRRSPPQFSNGTG
jgi:hypothetical protein